MKRILATLATLATLAGGAMAAGEDRVELSFAATGSWTNEVQYNMILHSVAVTIPSSPTVNTTDVYVVHGTVSNLISRQTSLSGFTTGLWITDGGIVRIKRGGQVVIQNSDTNDAVATIEMKKE